MTPVDRRQITLERALAAPIEAVWALWTTATGIESWWGPAGFAVTVQALDLRPGGVLLYTMTAVDAERIAFMRSAGMPVAQPARIVYTEITPPRRLAYTNAVDFVPGVAAYDARTLVELEPTASGTRLRLTIDAMHDELWTGRAVEGWTQELGKLERLVARGPA